MVKRLSFGAIFILLLIALVSFLIYWFAIRPAGIKQECSKKVINNAKEIEGVKWQDVNGAYEFCLHDRGL